MHALGPPVLILPSSSPIKLIWLYHHTKKHKPKPVQTDLVLNSLAQSLFWGI